VNLLDRARIERAVFAYGSHLEAHGIAGKRRRELRRELRANLFAAASDQGARAAVDSLGSLRGMAAEAGDPDPTRPVWSVAATRGVAVYAVLSVLGFLAGVWWAGGARAADPSATVTGPLLFFPGSEVTYDPATAGGGMAFEIGVGWGPTVVALAVFVVVSRPWRLATRRSVGVA
jgi:hypothetical protein